MFVQKRLSKVFNAAEEIQIDDNSKIIMFSDAHRGVNDWADDFGHNQHLLFHALQYYDKKGFTYIEMGDGDELWENRNFQDIRKSHSHIFWLMKKFFQDDRFYLIYGNHDIERRNQSRVEKTLFTYLEERTETVQTLFPGIKVHEGIVLKHNANGKKIFLVHGHQADPFNDRLWWLGRLVVRYFWKPLQLAGINDPTSPAKNYKKRIKVETRLNQWVEENGQVLIAGHTHRPRLPGKDKPAYFNAGSCVHPRCITGIEIEQGELMLIKWTIMPDDDGVLRVVREMIGKPRKI